MPLIAVSQTITEEAFTIKINSKIINKATSIYLLYQREGRKIVDSAEYKGGLYIFNGHIDDQPRYASIIALPAAINIENLIDGKEDASNIDVLQFYIHPGIIEISTDHLIANAKFTGSTINEDYLRLEKILEPITNKMEVISQEITATKDAEVAKELWKQYDSLKLAKRPLLKTFIQTNSTSFIALTTLKEYAGSFPDISTIEPMFLELATSVRNTSTGKEFYKFLMDRKNLTAGAKAPDFVQNDIAGNPVNFSSFRGQYVLLDFWASWCAPCRDANPGLTKIYQQFKNKNFTILGISLDNIDRKEAWLKAIKQDNLTWTQVSDLKHWENEVVKLYSIKAIPQNFLIDPEGIIIARGLNNEELEEKLNELLGK